MNERFWTAARTWCHRISILPACWKSFLRRVAIGISPELDPGKVTVDAPASCLRENPARRPEGACVFTDARLFDDQSCNSAAFPPSNPRALYFSDDIYIGWVPGDRIDIASIDPDLGCISLSSTFLATRICSSISVFSHNARD